MSRVRRTEQTSGLHYVVLVSNGSELLFRDNEDRKTFEAVLAVSLNVLAARIHAYCWTNQDARLVAEVAGSPLGSLIHRITSTYSRAFNARHQRTGPLFGGPYYSVPVDTDSVLLQLVRHLHRAPAETSGENGTEIKRATTLFPWCSHRNYEGTRPQAWLTTSRAMAALQNMTGDATAGYQALVAPTPATYLREEMNLGADGLTVHKGDADFLKLLRAESTERHKPASLEQILAAVAKRVGVQKEMILSSSSVRRLSLARALVTWHATRSGVATLMAVAAFVNRDPSTLYEGCERYRRLLPALFAESLQTLLSAKPHRGGAYSESNEARVSVDDNPRNQ